MTFRACVAAFCLTSVKICGQIQFFLFPIFPDLTGMTQKSFFFRLHSFLIWLRSGTKVFFSVSNHCWFDWGQGQKFFFPFPIIADLIDVSYKSIFFRLQSFLIWLPFARKVVFSVSNHCWFNCHLQEKFFFPFLFAADFCSCWTCVLYLIWLSNILKCL